MSRQRLEALVKAKALKKGGLKRTYEVGEDDIYDEVDEREFRQHQLERLKEDDFVVDDNGEGYVDDGAYEWDNNHRYADDESDEEGGKVQRPSKKSKIDKSKKDPPKNNRDVNDLFKRAATVSKPAPKKLTEEDDSYIGDLIENLGEDRVRVKNGTKKAGKLSLPKNRSSISTYGDSEPIILEKIEPGVPSSPPIQLNDNDDGYDADTRFSALSDDEDKIMVDTEQPQIEQKSEENENGGEEKNDESDDDNFSMKKIHTSNKIIPAANINSIRQQLQKPTLPTEAAVTAPANFVPSSNLNSEKSSILPTSEPYIPDKVDASNVKDESGKFLFFFMDHMEIGSTLLLFGKIKLRNSNQYVSCTLKVQGLCRDVYFLPNADLEDSPEEPALAQVHADVATIFSRDLGIKEFRSKTVVRKYCFELPDVPREAEYLKILLPFDTTLPVNFEKRLSTVSKIFGANTAMFEQFVLSRNIMGPGWLEVSNGIFDQGSETSSKVSVSISDPFDIISSPDIAPSPPLTMMSLSIKTLMNRKDNKQEVVAISFRICRDVPHDTTVPGENLDSTVTTLVRPVDQIFPSGFEDEFMKRQNQSRSCIKFSKESNLLTYFATQFQKYDVDAIFGHQLENIQLNILLHRMKDLNVRTWNRVGKFKQKSWPNRLDIKQCRDIFAGRLICDIANDMGRSITTKCDTWSLTEMVSLYLGQDRDEIDVDVSKFAHISEAKGLLHILEKSELDSLFVVAIAFKVQLLALSKQLTNLAGNSWARTLTGTRSDRNEFILLHEFFREKYIVPEKTVGFKSKANTSNEGANPSKAKYKGGLVFEPEKGLYKSIILVMDFNSLYPSIIQEFNICFTTVDRSKFNPDDDEPPPIPDSSERKGILPRLIETLVMRRRDVKRLMKSPSATEGEKAQWDIKQQALKLTANSMYGCLGFESSRFYALPLAMMTTFKGREILSNTKELMEDNGLRVVYGDTDSVMINTNALDFKEAMNIGNELKKKVNERYRKLEIDIDNVFKRLLLLQKKKYAAINMTQGSDGEIKTTMEIKGLDLKRREFCQLSKDASKYVLDQILNEENEDLLIGNIHEYLQDLGEKIRSNKISPGKFLIKNKLGKDPKDYRDKPPQVHVALRRIANGEIIKADDVITYIVTKDDNPNQSMGEKARTYTEVMKEKLQIDGEYYLVHQIYPAIKRLCAHLDGTDEACLAEYLGLDLKKHNLYEPSSNSAFAMDLQPLESTISDEERFKDAHRFKLACGCSHKFLYKGLEVGEDTGFDSLGVICPSCKQSMPFFKVNAQLEYAIRSEIADYYAGWLICDDSSCGIRTRQINVYGKKCPGQDGTCRGLMSYEYTDKMLYNQLLYFDSLFDVEKSKKRAKLSTEDIKEGLSKQQIEVLAEQNRARFGISRQVISKYLNNCGRRYVDMYGIFNFM